MTLGLSNIGNTIFANTINVVINTLQQVAGAVETSHYWLQDPSYVNGGNMNNWLLPISNVSVPVSASLDTSDNSPTGCNTPSTTHVGATGFQITDTTTGITTSAWVGGVYTLQY